MAKYENTWTFTTSDGGHVVTAKLTSDAWGRWFFNINVDGMTIRDGKIAIRDVKKGGDYPVRVGPHIGVIKISKKTLIISKTKIEFRIDGKVIPAGKHVTISQPPPKTPPPPTPAYQPPPPQPVQPAVQPQAGGTPMIPVVASKCPNCSTPLNMENVNWTGPMSAACPSCGTGVDVEWRKIGE